MAQVRLLVASPAAGQVRGHARQSSDDLIQDLEYHLGTTNTEYLVVRMTYRHSGFSYQGLLSDPTTPKASTTSWKPTDGVINIQTRMETSACAVINRHNSSSPWSPRPVPQPNPPLFEIIASHWGPVRARKVMSRVGSRARSPPPLRRLANLSPFPAPPAPLPMTSAPSRKSYETLQSTPAPPPTRAAPPIPKRQTSLHCASIPQYVAQNQESESSSAIDDYDRETDPARKIWSQMRRVSNSGGDRLKPTCHLSRVGKVPLSAALVPPSTPASVSRGLAVAVRRLSPARNTDITPSRKTGDGEATVKGGEKGGMDDDGERDIGNRRSLGGGCHARTLRGQSWLANIMADEKGEARCKRGVMAGGSVMGAGPAGIAVGVGLGAGSRLMVNVESVNSSGNLDGKEKSKDDGKWGWSGWWQ